MSIELAFRTDYFCVAVLLLFYSRTFVVSSVILAVAAWLAYGHVESNSTWQEVLAFLLTWAAAAVAAAAAGTSLNLAWMIDFEFRVLTKRRASLGVTEAITWLLACGTAVVAYACTEVAHYNSGTFYRLQSLALLVLLLLAIYMYDRVATNHNYQFLSPSVQYRHKIIAAIVLGAVSIDIIARDPPFWRYFVPAVLSWAALQIPKLLRLLSANTRRSQTKKSE